MKDFLQRLLQSRYVGLLEAELLRLRAEDRALTNSLLGTAGFPPVDFPADAKPQQLSRPRKRSWHQIQAWRESEAVRDTNLDSASIQPGPKRENHLAQKKKGRLNLSRPQIQTQLRTRTSLTDCDCLSTDNPWK